MKNVTEPLFASITFSKGKVNHPHQPIDKNKKLSYYYYIICIHHILFGKGEPSSPT